MSKSSHLYLPKPLTMPNTNTPQQQPTSFHHLLTTTNDFTDSFYGPNPPKMLCFGGYKKEEEAICSEITGSVEFKQIVCQSESSSASSANNSNSVISSSSVSLNRKRNGVGDGDGQSLVNGGLASKKGKIEKAAEPHAKAKQRAKPVRKEKIGERIATLQKLVSPFGKTDTASVLQEAYCYIKFLHDQVQVLSSPYLQISTNQGGEGLRGRGLCLVPSAYTAEVANTNGADYWAPAGMNQLS